jgi:hypothetical protein
MPRKPFAELADQFDVAKAEREKLADVDAASSVSDNEPAAFGDKRETFAMEG